MVQSTADQLRKKGRTRLAVGLAMERRWGEAVAVNREILEQAPNNIEAINRMAKALTELGQYAEARTGFQRVLELSPSNAIAKKNLDRITLLRDQDAPGGEGKVVPPHFFIEETGKTGLTALVDVAPRETLAKLTAGQTIHLVSEEHKLLVKSIQGEYLGTVEPKLGLRLLRLLRAGNRYEAAISALDQTLRIIIRESYQHPGQQGRFSFPPKGQDSFRGYVWEGSSGFIAEDQDAGGDAEDTSDEDGVDPEDAMYKPRGRSRKSADPDGESEAD